MASSCVVPHLKILRRVGFIGLQPPRPNAPGASPRARRLHNFYCWFTLVGTSFHVLQHLICAYQGRHDVAGLSRTLYEMFSFCTCVSKQVAIRVHQRRVDLLLAALDDPLYNQPGERFARMMRETAKGAKMIMRTFYSCGVCTVTLWLTFPVVHRLKGNYVEFPFWTFVDYTEPKMFALVALHSAYMTALLSMGNTTTDVFIGSLLYQCTTQLRILRINFESLTERARKLSEELNESYETTLRKLLVECIQHFQKIADMTEEILAVFGEAILVLFGVGAWMMCTAAYTLISVGVQSIEFASSTFFIICILIELYIYCYFGNEVTLESSCIVQSIYNMQWVDTPLWFQKALVLVMERAKRPLLPTAIGLIPLSLDTFVKILKSTYSFFSVLRQTK